MNKKNIRLILNIITLLTTGVLLVISAFAWYITNKEVRATGITAVSASDDTVEILDTVIAKRFCLNEDTITDTYKKTNGNLVLQKEEIYTKATNTTEVITEFETIEYFRVKEMLPGEYVNITLGYKMDKDNNAYKIHLRNITGGEFTVDGYNHYVTGVFRYQSLSLKDKAGNDVADFTPDEDYTWFSGYKIDENDSEALEQVILEHTWKNSYEELYYTFSITEDFSQYYKLISQAQNSYGNLLSQKNFNIGEIFIYVG